MTVGGAFVYVCENLVEIAWKILNNVRVYNESVITRFFPDNRVIIESQCIA